MSPPSSIGSREEKGPLLTSHTVAPHTLTGVPRKPTRRGFPSLAGAVDALVSAVGEGETRGQQFCLAPRDLHEPGDPL